MNEIRYKIVLVVILTIVIDLIAEAQEYSSINPGVEYIGIVNSSHPLARQLERAIKDANYNPPENTYVNSIQSTVFVSTQDLQKEEQIIGFLEEKKIGNELLAFLLNEKNDTINNRRILERAKKELTQLQYESLLRRGTDEASLLKEMTNLVDNNFFLVYRYTDITEYNVIDTSYNAITNKFKIAEKKGVTAKLHKYVIKPNLSEFVLNSEFYEKGYTYSNVQYTAEEIASKKAYRDELKIPLEVLGSTTEDIKSYTELSSELYSFKSLSEAQQEKVKKASDALGKNQRYKARPVSIAKGSKNLEEIVAMLMKAPRTTDFEELAPRSVTEKRGYVTETAAERSGKVAKKDRGIRVNLGKEQGLRTNHRYKFVRTIQNSKTGIEKEKVVGTGLATRYIPKSARGKENLGKTAQFKQIYGGKVRQFDKAIEDRVSSTVYAGFGNRGLKLMVDFYLRGKLGRKFYFDLGYDIDGIRPLGFGDGIIGPDGDVLSVDMDILHLGLGFAKEYYFNRFYVGYQIGARFFNATFSSDVEDILIPEEEKRYYAYDISFDVGLNAGVRITKDFALNVHAAGLIADFNNPLDGDGRDIPDLNFEEFNTNISASVSYTIPKFSKSKKKEKATKAGLSFFDKLITK